MTQPLSLITSTARTNTSTTTTSNDDVLIIEPQSYQGIIQTTSNYNLTGSFTYEVVDGRLVLFLGNNYKASTSLSGLYVYLSNNPNSTAEAYEIGAVTVFEGEHS